MEKELRRQTIEAMTFAIIGRAGVFALPLVVGTVFGADWRTDAFFLAYSVVIFVNMVVIGAFESIIVPYAMEGEFSLFGFQARRLLKLLVVAAFGVYLFNRFLLPSISGLSKEAQRLAGQVSAVLVCIIPLAGLNGFIAGLHYADRKFAFPASSPVVSAGVAISFILLGHKEFGIWTLPWGLLAGELARTVFLIAGHRAVLQGRYEHRKASGFERVLLFQLFAGAIAGLTLVIDKFMASYMGAGDVSLLEYAWRVSLVPMVIISRGVFLVRLPHWAEEIKNFGRERVYTSFKASFKKFALWSIIASLIFTIAALWMSKKDVGLVSKVAAIGVGYFLGFAPRVLNIALSRLFQALKRTEVLFIIVSGLMPLKILMNYLLMKVVGVGGIALSTSLFDTMMLVGLWLGLLRLQQSDKLGGEING